MLQWVFMCTLQNDCLYLFSEARSDDGENGWTNCLANAHRLPFEEFCSIKGFILMMS